MTSYAFSITDLRQDYGSVFKLIIVNLKEKEKKKTLDLSP